jgi:hypothetical protein
MRFHSIFFILLVLIVSLLTACTTTAPRRTDIDSVKIKEVKPRQMAETDFVRLREYYSGTENTGRRLFLRSDPDARAGYYFTVILDINIAKLPRGTRIELKVFSPFENAMQEFVFALPRERPRTREVFLGLTGEHWQDTNLPPSAWKINILNPRGRVIGTYQSFLWD